MAGQRSDRRGSTTGAKAGTGAAKVGVVVVVIAVTAAVAVGGLFVANGYIARRVDAELRRGIVDSGLATAVDYAEVTANAAAGTITVRDVRLADAGAPLVLQAETLTIQIAPSQALQLVRSPDQANLRSVDVDVRGARVSDRDGSVGVRAERVVLRVSGQNLQSFVAAGRAGVGANVAGAAGGGAAGGVSPAVSGLSLHADGLQIVAPLTGFAYRIGNINFQIDGAFGAADPAHDFTDQLLRDIQSAVITLTLTDAAVDMDVEQRRRFQIMIGNTQSIANPDNWSIARLHAVIQIADTAAPAAPEDAAAPAHAMAPALDVAEFAVASGLITADGSGTVAFNDDFDLERLSATLTVQDLEPGLRDFLGGVVAMFGQELPAAGAFGLDLAVVAGQFPLIRVRND